MKLDESFDDNDKDEENKPEQQKNPKNQEQNTKTQEEEQEMSIKTGVPDLENEAKEINQEEEEIEIEDKSKSDFKKNIKKSLGDLKYKTYTEEFDEVIKAEELESEDELIRLRKNLDQQLLQLKKILFQNLQINYKENFWRNKTDLGILI